MSEAATSSDIDRVVKAIEDLKHDFKPSILLEERQAAQGARLGGIESRLAVDESLTKALEKKLDQWINRGFGLWIAALLIFSIVNAPVIIQFLRK